jgi:glycerol-3-phosphate acyltransferase PlsY
MPVVIVIWASLIAVFSYLLGSIPFSYIVAKLYGKNLYQIGSGNIGSANVYRATGRFEALLIALAGDLGKGFLAIILAQKMSEGCFASLLLLGQAIAAFFVVSGHNWPIFLKFKGGRGLASLAGVILALNWKIIFLVLAVIAFFIFLTELIMKKGIKLEGKFKEKLKKLFSIFISQVLGRVIGLLAAAVSVYILFPDAFKVLFGAAILSGIKHIKRTKTFLEGKII